MRLETELSVEQASAGRERATTLPPYEELSGDE
jgi:hypothetical protein